MTERANNLLSTYHVFISYTSADKELAEYLTNELRRILNNYEAVYNFLLPGTQDSVAGSRPGDDIAEVINKSLKSCNVFILLWSETAKKQHWVRYELNRATDFLIHKAKRKGKDFKLIPISIDRCSMPFGIQNLVHVTYTSNTDPQGTLNKVLTVLGLPLERDDPHIVFVKKVRFEVNTMFERGEWSDFLQKYAAFVQAYPTYVSTEMRYKHALALFYLGQMEKSLIVVNEGLILENREADLALLRRYVKLLVEKRLWNEVLALVEKVLVKFPTHTDWHQIKWDVASHMNGPSSFFLPSNHQMIQQPNQIINVGANGTNGARTQVAENLNTSFVPFQQASSLFQNDFSSNIPIATQQLNSQSSISQSDLLSQNSQSHVTRKLSEEELQTEMESSSISSWQKADDFTEKHISLFKIEKVLEPSVIFVAIINILYIAFVSFLLSPDTYLVAFEAILLLLILCIGRFVESETVKLACIILLSTFWMITGYVCGYHLYNQLGWGTERSLGLCMGIIFAIVVASVGGRFHLQLFYNQKR